LESRGLVQLPPQLKAARRPGYQNRVPTLTLDPSPVALKRAVIDSELSLAQGGRGTTVEKFFNGLIHADHHLGFQPPTGPSLKSILFWKDRPLAGARFGSAAGMVTRRDRYSGWSPEQRHARRPAVVNHDRFLILPWVRVPHWASYTWARIGRQLVADGRAVYSQTIRWAETLVEGSRFAGTCYAASHWIWVGQTQGRGRNQPTGEAPVPIKSVWLEPLARDFQRRWCAGARRRSNGSRSGSGSWNC
jgi:hypothetical protein